MPAWPLRTVRDTAANCTLPEASQIAVVQVLTCAVPETIVDYEQFHCSSLSKTSVPVPTGVPVTFAESNVPALYAGPAVRKTVPA